MISAGKATLLELSTEYGVEDLYDMIEIIVINAHNERVMAREK